ncbi:uncharacterized protein LOC132698923 [Cylas formicarius]|uniref:uncharacterized protein LOC132698923 n=1 Tax=Cylas formicarius TaxID=197179 RepID=UPI00295858C7|nr:uncharacterized protein LOC132698923 [Cylas formicarius]
MKDSGYSQFLTTTNDFLNEIFGICKACLSEEIMAAVPQGVFAAEKVRKNLESAENHYYRDNTSLNATNYSSKYMNSIWGMYNRFSVHNLKKVMDDNKLQHQVLGSGGEPRATGSKLSVSVERLCHLPL